MTYKVALLGHPQWLPELEKLHREALNTAGMPIELAVHDVPPEGLHSVLADIKADPACLGAALFGQYGRPALAYSQYSSAAASASGIADTLIRGRDGALYADTTAVRAFGDALGAAGVHTTRTALILGGGNLARVALAALRDMGCQRFLIGYRHPRRPAELSSLFKSLRRNLSFFPLSEMQGFFAWADRRGLMPLRSMVPPPEDLPGRKKAHDQAFKRWDILVQATPIGLRPDEEPLVSNDSFLRCFSFVFDLVPEQTNTVLTSLAQQAGVPALSGYGLLKRQAELARSLWTAQYKRLERGEPDAPLDFEGAIAVEVKRARRGRRGPGSGGGGRDEGQSAQPSKAYVVKRRN